MRCSSQLGRAEHNWQGDSHFSVARKKSPSSSGGNAFLVVAVDIETESCYSALAVFVLVRSASLADYHLEVELHQLEEYGHCQSPFLVMLWIEMDVEH